MAYGIDEHKDTLSHGVWHKIAEIGGRGSMQVFSYIVVSVCVVWAVHSFTPWGWLDTSEPINIASFIFTGILGLGISIFLQRCLRRFF